MTTLATAMTMVARISHLYLLICGNAVEVDKAPRDGPAVTRDPEIRLLDLSQVPDGEALKGARTRRDLMICLVSEKWAQMSDDERREKLRHWLTFGKDKGVGIVTLLNEQGQTVGSASSEAITLEHP